MVLKLQVLNDPNGRPDPVVIREVGGTIGRSNSCSCVLADQAVSKLHAQIMFRGGAFYIEDTSQNGVCLNSSSNKLTKGQPYELHSGDLILIDAYEIRVTVEEGFQTRSAPMLDPFVTGSVDPDVLIPDLPKKRSGRKLDDLSSPNAHNQPFRPPQPIVPDPTPEPPADKPGQIPEDWDKDTGFGEKAAPSAAPKPKSTARPTPPPQEIDSDPTPYPPEDANAGQRPTGELSEVLKGAGLAPNLVTPELARDFGRIIYIIIKGLMDLLQARQEIKNEFDMQVTQFRVSRNNPLKFSADVEHALENLLVTRTKAFLEPVAAFEDAFDDVRHHQVAMLVGMRAGFETMIRTFHPDALQEQFDKHAKGSMISLPAKLRYWDQYRAKFGDMFADTERSFKELFGEEFTRAYEEQLERLKTERRSDRSKS